MATCGSCGAAIVWAETKNGKQMPMNVETVPCSKCAGNGRIGLLSDPCKTCNGTGAIHVTHFATCPNAAQHRRKAMSDERCGTCGAVGTVVSGACVVCGAGVVYRVARRFGPKKRREHRTHAWGFVGMTFENGTRARKEKCTKADCAAERLVEVGG